MSSEKFYPESRNARLQTEIKKWGAISILILLLKGQLRVYENKLCSSPSGQQITAKMNGVFASSNRKR
jgi:hypothetical protein